MRERHLGWFLFTLLLSSFTSAMSDGPLRIDGSDGARPLRAALAVSYRENDPGRTVGIGAGMPVEERLAALDDGSIDLIMASHGLDEDALRAAGYVVYRFAQMPVVLAINTEGNRMAAITTAQLCGIYAGEYSNWQALRGPDMPVRAFARPRAEVDMEVLEARLPCFGSVPMAGHVQTKERSGELAQALIDTPGAIGMTTMTRVLASGGQLRALALDGVLPDHGNMTNGTYPLMRDVFLVARPDASPAVLDFLEFVGGPGMEVVSREQAVPRSRNGF